MGTAVSGMAWPILHSVSASTQAHEGAVPAAILHACHQLTSPGGAQVSVMPQCGHVAAVLDAHSLAAACGAFGAAVGHAAGAIFTDAYLSLAALGLLFVLSLAFAKGGGAGAVPVAPSPPGGQESFWVTLAIRCGPRMCRCIRLPARGCSFQRVGCRPSKPGGRLSRAGWHAWPAKAAHSSLFGHDSTLEPRA